MSNNLLPQTVYTFLVYQPPQQNMTHGNLRQVLTCGCRKKPKPQSDSRTKEPKAHEGLETEQMNESSYANLSEIASPCPVRRPCQEDARRESLDNNLAQTHLKPQLSNN
jgi:hypothetical protein